MTPALLKRLVDGHDRPGWGFTPGPPLGGVITDPEGNRAGVWFSRCTTGDAPSGSRLENVIVVSLPGPGQRPLFA